MRNLKFSLLLSVFALVNFTNAQQNETKDNLSLNDGSIDSQFDYIFKNSGNYRGTNGLNYKVVKRSDLNKIKANVLDSLQTSYSKISSSEQKINTQNKEIESLKTELANTQTNLENTNAEKDSMSLFGMQMSKPGYNTLMWTIIAILLASLLFFLMKFKNSNAITKDAKKKLEEVEVEYEEHRRVALEREQKVRRQLQDEINKNKN